MVEQSVLKEDALIKFMEDSDTHVIFKANVADRYGGAIYIQDASWARRRI